jgi:uncharacterized membrane protein YjdF
METQSIQRFLSFLIKAILFVEAVVAVWGQQWLTVAITVGIIAITFIPLLMAKKFQIYIPQEFELLAIIFIFASLFLGEVRGYYLRFWWWDIALHTGSGLLLGVIGFLLVYILNEIEEIRLRMTSGFVAFFAFLFAVSIGALWEIFEFAMDSFFGMNMQKATLGDPSGLTDTMRDLIVDTLGALVISVLGYGYLKAGRKESFLERWIAAFIQKNPRFFTRRRYHFRRKKKPIVGTDTLNSADKENRTN